MSSSEVHTHLDYFLLYLVTPSKKHSESSSLIKPIFIILCTLNVNGIMPVRPIPFKFFLFITICVFDLCNDVFVITLIIC